MELRYNAFLMVHKGLRAMMYDTAITLQHTDFTDVTKALLAMENVELVLENFDDHADHEDTHVLHGLDKIDNSLAASFEQEHVVDRELCERLRNAIKIYKIATNNIDRIKAGNKVFYAFNDFIAFNLQHMNKEENQLNESMWANYTDAEIIDMQKKIVASIAPDKMAVSSTWMLRGCSNPELVNWLMSIRASAPPHIFDAMMQMVKQELPEHRHETINAKLLEATMG